MTSCPPGSREPRQWRALWSPPGPPRVGAASAGGAHGETRRGRVLSAASSLGPLRPHLGISQAEGGGGTRTLPPLHPLVGHHSPAWWVRGEGGHVPSHTPGPEGFPSGLSGLRLLYVPSSLHRGNTGHLEEDCLFGEGRCVTCPASD